MARESMMENTTKTVVVTLFPCRTLIYLTLLGLLTGAGRAQWLETTISLPDSMAGIAGPRALGYNSLNNSVYVGGEYNGELAVIDGNTNQHVARIPLYPYWKETADFCLDSARNKLYSMSLEGSIAVIDCNTNSVLTYIPTFGSPASLCYDRANDRVYCAAGLFVAVIDCAGDTVARDIGAPAGCWYLCMNATGDRIYAASSFGNSVSVIDTRLDSVIATIAVGDSPCAICANPANNRVYCANGASHSISVIDGNTNQVVKTLALGSPPGLLCANPQDNKVYCGIHNAHRADTLFVISGVSDSVVASPALGGIADALLYQPDGDRIYCACRGMASAAGHVVVLDGRTDQVIATPAVGWFPWCLCRNTRQNRIYTANVTDGSITVIEGASDTVVATITVGCHPTAACYCPVGRKLFVPHWGAPGVSIVSAAENRVVGDIDAGIPGAICLGPSDKKVYCTSSGNAVAAIDARGDSLLKMLSVGSYPSALCLDPEKDRVYCANQGSANVSVIDGAIDSVAATIAVNGGPLALCYDPLQHKMYCGTESGIVAISTESLAVVKNIPTSAPAAVLAYDAVQNRVYCGLTPNFSVVVIDCLRDSIVDTLHMNGPVRGIYCNQRENKVYCSAEQLYGGGWLEVLDARTDSLLSVLPFIQYGGAALCCDTVANRLYCTGQGGTVSVVDCHNDSCLTSFDLPAVALAWDPVDRRIFTANQYGSSVSVIRDSATTGIEGDASPIGPTVDLIISSNPIRGRSRIRFQLAEPAKVRLTLCDITGRTVAVLADGTMRPGTYRWDWEATTVPSGVYFLTLSAGTVREARKLVVTK